MATLLKMDGTSQTIHPANYKNFKLKQLSDYVGGLIEIVNLNNGKILVINDEGKFEHLEINQEATKLAHKNNAIYIWDVIVGDVVYCNDEEVL